MRKRFLSLLCVLALCLGLLPVTALAAEGAPNTLYVGNQNVKSGEDTTYWATTDNGELKLVEGASDTSNNWNVKYDPSTATLTLKNATIKTTHDGSRGAMIYAQSVGSRAVSLTIQLVGENTIVCDSAYYGIYVDAEMSNDSYGTDASLTITGNGSLEVSGSSYGIWVKSGTGNASLNIKNVAVTSSTNGDYAAGVCVQSSTKATGSPQLSLAVDGGSLTTSASEGNDGIQFYVGLSEATGATTSLTVSDNAIVRANGGIKASRVDEPTPSGTGIVFDGKEGTVYGDVTLDESLTINQGETLTIPDGASLTIGNDATLTNNGTVTTTDGGSLTNQGTINNSGTLPDNIQGSAPPKITTPSLHYGEVDKNYSQPLAADNNPTSWSVTNGTLPNGLTLENGTISGIPTAAGTSTFTVKAENTAGSDSKELTLTINPAPVLVTSVALNKSELSLYTGQSEILTATVQPEDATNKTVTWSTSNASVATVENGVVTAVAAGTATITVTTEDGNKTATCAVTVEKPYTPPPYIPPTKTPSQQAVDKIEDAKEGSTVKITLRTGQTKLDKEVFEELAGRDVTLEISLPGGVTWTVNGEDIPKTADLTDLDMGVSLNTSTIPVDLINAITGEIGTVQLTLKHDGPFGFTMTLTAPVGKGNKGLWANLYHYDEDAGKMVYQTAALVDKDGNVALPFDHASQYALVLDSKSHDLPFTDLAANAWYTDAVAYVYRHDIMEGMSATTFQPNGTLSRAMAVQIFYNLEGQPDISGENLGYPYEDVNAQAWYGDAVYWARITGVATGYGDGTFQPTDSITRQEFAQMLYNYAKYKGYDLSAEGDLSQFLDSGSVADWAEIAMSWANGNELINGHDGTIDAAGAGTRAQAASILMRFDQNLVEK